MRTVRSSERPVPHVDPGTGARYRQLTSSAAGFQHLYFTSPSFTLDGRLVLIGDVDGNPNLFTLRIDDGRLAQLTHNRDGTQQSYIYFDEQRGRGFQKASPSFCPATNQVLYVSGAEARLVDLDSAEEQVLFTLPRGAISAYTHLSRDGRWACVPYLPEEAFDFPPVREPIPALAQIGWLATDPFMGIRDRFGPAGLCTDVAIIDTHSSDTSRSFSTPGWVTHVQFSPADPGDLLFNHEGGTELPDELGTVEQRIWLHRAGEQRRVRDQRRTPGVDLFIEHEVWLEAGDAVIYHGSALDERGRRRQFVGRAEIEPDVHVEVPFPPGLTAFSHFSPAGAGDRLITDGVIDTTSLSLCDVDWGASRLSWRRLCGHHTSWANQDVHPHPIFSPDERAIAWASDQHNERGRPHVYLLELDHADPGAGT